MIPFKKFIKEQNLFEAKNAHLSHIDQSVLIDGGDGIKTTINFRESLIDMLSGCNNVK